VQTPDEQVMDANTTHLVSSIVISLYNHWCCVKKVVGCPPESLNNLLRWLFFMQPYTKNIAQPPLPIPKPVLMAVQGYAP